MNRASITGRDPASGNSIAVEIEGERICRITDGPEPSDLWISSGLIDLQVNGYRGLNLNGEGARAATVSDLTREMLANGVTTYAPTVVTAPEHVMVHCLACIAEAYDSDEIVRRCVPFIHVEGPHISPVDGYRGAHPLAAVRPPSLEEFERWQTASRGLIGLVTISPHFPESEEYIAALTAQGVHVAIGHTHASAEQIRRAVEAGARLSTHLGNGIATELDRHRNPLWSQLAEERLTATFIADGQHLPAEALRAMIRAKGLERSLLVSDVVALGGMSAGMYTLPTGPVELTAGGRLEVMGTQLLAGAVVPLIFCVGNVVNMAGLSLAEGLRMATEIPGRLVGGRGRLLPGQRADLLRFRWVEGSPLTVADVWLAGEAVFSSP
jgi:N-acetylglucosamine-6-phosphate deacetylase